MLAWLAGMAWHGWFWFGTDARIISLLFCLRNIELLHGLPGTGSWFQNWDRPVSGLPACAQDWVELSSVNPAAVFHHVYFEVLHGRLLSSPLLLLPAPLHPTCSLPTLSPTYLSPPPFLPYLSSPALSAPLPSCPFPCPLFSPLLLL